VLLDGDDRPGFPRGRQHRLLVQRLHGVHAQHAGPDPLRLQQAGGLESPVGDGARADQGQVRPVPHLDGPADLEVDRTGVQLRLLLVAAAVVDRPVVGDHGAGRGLRLGEIRRRQDHHVGQGPHDGQVLGGLVGHPESAVGQAAADDHDLDVGPVVAHVVADLLQAAQGREVGDRVGDGDVAFHGHAAGHAGHVLLGHPHVEETVGEALGEALDLAVADVGQDHVDPLVLLGELQQHLVKQGTHRTLLARRTLP
jgi:hypothetical protein